MAIDSPSFDEEATVGDPTETHSPGVEQELLHPYQQDSERRLTVEDFHPFIKLRDESQREKLAATMAELYELTGVTWNPDGGRSDGIITTMADLWRQHGDQNIEIVPMISGKKTHRFLQVRLPGAERPLVIDPFGILNRRASSTDYARRRTPFFGDASLAPELHTIIYDSARPIESTNG